MAIIILKGGKGARKVEQAPVKEEDYLQQYVAENPDSLPLTDIKEDATKLLVIGREFGTDSGPIDVLAIDRDGDLYIIETKLFKNPDKRLVIAQMLDYGAAIWKAYGDGEEFLSEINELLSKSEADGLSQRLHSLYGLSEAEVEVFREKVKRNLSDGNIKFVVLMDRLHDRLRDLILFINEKSRFNIYAVEMEFYEFEGMEIVIPKLYGAEVKKEVSSGGIGRRTRLHSEEEFLKRIENESAKNIFQKLLKLGDDLGAVRFLGASGISVKFPDPKGSKKAVTLFVIDADGEVYFGWSTQQLDALGLPSTLGIEYIKSLATLFPGTTPEPKYGDSLSRELTAEEVGRVFDKFAATVTSFVTQIKKASEATSRLAGT